jgi:fumarate reductase flavoprotein subunit
MIPGGLFRRANTPIEPLGIAFIDAFQKYFERPGSRAEVLLETRATELITRDGRVVGVRATNADNNTVVVRANNGVVMATGGYSGNVEMRLHYDQQWSGRLTADVPNTNQPTMRGDGITMGLAVGANLVGMEYTQLVPFGAPSGAPSGLLGLSMEDTIYINKEGRRFVNENERRDVLTFATWDQTDGTLFVVIDSRTVPTGEEKNIFNETHNFMVEYGAAVKANTLEELAVLMRVPPAAFVQTVAEFNAAVDGRSQCPFGRTTFLGRIEKPPFYGGPRKPTVHHTMGGLQIDVNARVLNNNGAPIPGFYAAGEVAGGVHGSNRVGGNAVTDIMVFGRIAGTSIAERR